MSDLIVLENLPPPAVIYASGGAEDLLNRIKNEARNRVLDISTKKGRDEVASLAYKIARAKTALDDMGKILIEEHQKTVNSVNAERKRIRDELDSLKDEVRAPLTEWEQKEKDRVASLESALALLEGQINYPNDYTADEIENRLKAVKYGDEFFDWMEFADRAARARESVISKLEAALVRRRDYEEAQAELKRLREEEEKRKQKERDEEIARQAAEKAHKEAEEKAEQERRAAETERQRIEKEKQDAIDRAIKAEQDRVAAEERAKAEAHAAAERAEREKQDAIRKERERVEAEKKAEADALAKREADKKHKDKIHNEVMLAILHLLSEAHEETADDAKAIIQAIAEGKIPHVRITY